MRDFVTALEFLTRLRFSNRIKWNDDDFGRSVFWFPVVGLLAGAILSGVNWQLEQFYVPSFLRSVFLIVAELFFFGSLMYDGYMDTCDGIFSARDRERMLEIMKDSHVGANAVLGVCILLLLKMAMFITLDPWKLSKALLVGYVLTRSLMSFYIVAYPYPREKGIGKMFKDYAKSWYPVSGLLILIFVVYFCGWQYGIAAAVAFLFMNIWAKYLQNLLGGLTGDTFGFLTEVGFVMYLLILFVVDKFYNW